jgi:hypothetical protein
MAFFEKCLVIRIEILALIVMYKEPWGTEKSLDRIYQTVKKSRIAKIWLFIS